MFKEEPNSFKDKSKFRKFLERLAPTNKEQVQQQSDKAKIDQIKRAQKGTDIHFTGDKEQLKIDVKAFLLQPRITLEQVSSAFFETAYTDGELFLHETDSLSDFFSTQEIAVLFIGKVAQQGSIESQLNDNNRELIVNISLVLIKEGLGNVITLVNQPFFSEEQKELVYETLFDRSEYADQTITSNLFNSFSLSSEIVNNHCEVASAGIVFFRALLSMIRDSGEQWENLDANLKNQIREKFNQELSYILSISELPFEQPLNGSDKVIFQEISLRKAKLLLDTFLQGEGINLPEEFKRDTNQMFEELHSRQKLQSYNLDFITSLVPLDELAEEFESPIVQLIFLKQKLNVPFLPDEFGNYPLEKISNELQDLVDILSDQDTAERLAPVLAFFSSSAGNTKNLSELLEGSTKDEKAEHREHLKSIVHSEPLFSILARVIYRTGEYRNSFMRALLCGWCNGVQFYDGLTADEKNEVLFADFDQVTISSGNNMQLCGEAENRMRTAVNGGQADAGLGVTKPLEAVVPWVPSVTMTSSNLDKPPAMGIVKYYGRPIALCTNVTVTPNGVFLPGSWWTQIGEGIDDQILAKGYVSLDDRDQAGKPWILIRMSKLDVVFEKTTQYKVEERDIPLGPPSNSEFTSMYGAG